MLETYVADLNVLRRTYRNFLLNIRSFLRSKNYMDINANQALIIYFAGQKVSTIGSVIRSCFYEDSNPSHNIKSLINEGYMVSNQDSRDKRVFFLHLTPKGQEIYDHLQPLFQHHVKLLHRQRMIEQWEQWIHFCQQLERFWLFPYTYQLDDG